MNPTTACPCPLFDQPIAGTRLDYVFRREREGDYLARIIRERDGHWFTGLGPTAKAAVAAALAAPLRSGTCDSLAPATPPDPSAPDETGPEATAQGCPA